MKKQNTRFLLWVPTITKHVRIYGNEIKEIQGNAERTGNRVEITKGDGLCFVSIHPIKTP